MGFFCGGSHVDRRAENRISYAARAEGFLGNRAFSCELRDLSVGGALVLPTVEMKRGQFLRMNLVLPSLEEVVDVDAVIVRETVCEGRPAVAVQFHGLAPRSETLLRTYVEWARRSREATSAPGDAAPAVRPPARERVVTGTAPVKPPSGERTAAPPVRSPPGETGASRQRPTSSSYSARPGTGPGQPAVRTATGSATRPETVAARAASPAPSARPPSALTQPARPATPAPSPRVARPPTADALANRAELASLYRMALGELEKGEPRPAARRLFGRPDKS